MSFFAGLPGFGMKLALLEGQITPTTNKEETMKIQEATQAMKRYQALKAEGKGRNMDKKIALVQDHLTRLREMQAGGKSPWHNYGDMVSMYHLEDFYPRGINR